MASLEEMPKDVIAHILWWCSTTDAYCVMLTCRSLSETVQRSVLAPWNNNCRGLVHALERGHMAYFKRYVEQAGKKRWDPSKAVAPFLHMMCPLLSAVAGRGNVEAVRIVLGDVRVDPRADCSSALRYAAGAGNMEVVQELLKDGRANPASLDSDALVQAAYGGHMKVCQLLVADGRVCVKDARDRASNQMFQSWGRVDKQWKRAADILRTFETGQYCVIF
jgi:hypothetical protein